MSVLIRPTDIACRLEANIYIPKYANIHVVYNFLMLYIVHVFYVIIIIYCYFLYFMLVGLVHMKRILINNKKL